MDNNNTPENVSYTVYQEAQARADRRFKYMWITVIFLIMLLVGTNVGWIIYESQYIESVTVSQDVNTQSSPAYVNGTGEMTVNGEDKANNN